MTSERRRAFFKLKSTMTSLRRSQVNPLSVNDFFYQLRKKTKEIF